MCCTASADAVRIFSLADGWCEHVLAIGGDSVAFNCMALGTAAGRRVIAAGCDDGSIVVWSSDGDRFVTGLSGLCTVF
jgi:hypothetical protein